MSATESQSTDVSTVTKVLLGTSGLALLILSLYLLLSIVKCLSSAARLVKNKGTAKETVSKEKAKPVTIERPEPVPVKVRKERTLDLKELIKAEKAYKRSSKGSNKEEVQHQHELFVNVLKGHGDAVTGLAWSPDGSQLATACEDMFLRIFDTSDLLSKDPRVRRVKTTRKPVGVGFADGPDVLATALDGLADTQVALYAPAVAPVGAQTYDQKILVPKVLEREPLLKAVVVPDSMAVGGRGFIACCSQKKNVKIVNFAGKTLATLEPNSLVNHDLAVSDNGRFLAVASFTAEAKIWEMTYTREREFKGCHKVMDLSGHRGQLSSVALSPCGRRAATASRDGTLRIWNIDVRYALSEDPKTTLLIPMSLPAGKAYERMAFGPNGLLAATYGDGHFHLLNTTSGDLLDSVLAHDLPVTHLSWCPVQKDVAGEKKWVLATGSADKRVRLWKI